MLKSLFVVSILACSTLAGAMTMAEFITADTNKYVRFIREEISLIQKSNQASARDPKAPATCLNRYDRILRDGVYNITLGLGYYDALPNDYVGDASIHLALVRVLQEPCQSKISACGFRYNKAEDVLVKTIKNISGKPYTVKLKIVRGSISLSNKYNTTVAKAEQKKVCEAATKVYNGAIAKGEEVVIYSGHSRDSGGPDFCPAVVDKHNHTNYDWYHRNKPGRKAQLAALSSAVKNDKVPEVIVMNSCNSKRFFYPRINAIAPTVGFIGSTKSVKQKEDTMATYGALDSFIGLKCYSALKDAISPGNAMVTENLFPGNL